ncbi:MAG: LCP family protein, partial [Clostridia bacterium]
MKEHNFNKPQGKTQIQPTRKQKVVRGRPSPESVSTETSISNRKRKVRKKKWSVKKKIMLIIPIVLLILFLGGCLAFQYIFGGLNVREITIDPVELGVDTSASEKSKEYKITNIALFGVDSRNPNRNVGRSDSIIILSVDQKNNILKMTSILRDSKVKIEGHGEEKITHAYAYGGPELAIKTLNENFHLDIQDYATVNFSQ